MKSFAGARSGPVVTPRRLKALRREIGIVFQSYNLFPHLCVERNITLGPTAAKGIKPAAARELARKVPAAPAPVTSAAAARAYSPQKPPQIHRAGSRLFTQRYGHREPTF